MPSKRWLSVCFTFMLPATPTLAEPPTKATATNADISNVVAYEFGDEQVSGDLVAPLGEVLTVRNKNNKHSLVRARGSFIDKLVRAVENL
jgi:hypothetical protein